jgi:hypothetical protein
MKVVFINTPRPSSYEFGMFEKFPVELLKETKTLTIMPHFKTKTRVSTSILIGRHSSRINIPIEGFKTHEDVQWNMFSGEQEVSNYFIKSKKQDIECYKRYLTEVLKSYFEKFGIDELTVKFIDYHWES